MGGLNTLRRAFVNGAHMMRDGALEALNNDDLQFSPGGDSLSLGELFKQLGETQHSYTESFKTGQHDWSYHNDADGLSTNLEQLKNWFAELDNQMMILLDQFTEDDMERKIDRGNRITRTVDQQIEIYIQAMLIFLGKVVIYFKAMQKPLPNSIEHYIG